MRHVRRLLDALGTAGVAGIGVLLFCGAFYFNWLAPATAELERRSAAALKGVPAQALRDDPAAELERFYSRFPSVERLPGEPVDRLDGDLCGRWMELSFDVGPWRRRVLGKLGRDRNELLLPESAEFLLNGRPSGAVPELKPALKREQLVIHERHDVVLNVNEARHVDQHRVMDPNLTSRPPCGADKNEAADRSAQ